MSRIVDIWTLEYLSHPCSDQKKEDARRLHIEAVRAVKYVVRLAWEELALELDNLSREEAIKEMEKNNV